MRLSCPITILGHRWVLLFMPQAAYDSRHGDDSEGCTMQNTRRIYISEEGASYQTIVHELVHAYMGELCVSTTTRLSKNDLEEIFCELVAKHGKQIIRLARQLERAYRKECK